MADDKLRDQVAKAVCSIAIGSERVESVMDIIREHVAAAVQAERERPPTQWAYDQACKALHKHRDRAETAEAAIERVRAITGNWSGGPCISGYRIPNDDDSDSECLHCAAAAIRAALDGTEATP